MTAKLFTSQATGLQVYTSPTSGDERHLGRLPPTRKHHVLRAGSLTMRQSDIPLIPRDKWRNVDLKKLFTVKFNKNQKSHGSCVGYSCAAARTKTYVARGMSFHDLSGSYIYSWINGGHDNGAVITDALGESLDHGSCLETSCGWDNIYRRGTKQFDSEASKYLMKKGVIINTADELGSAIQHLATAIESGNVNDPTSPVLIPQFAIQVGSNFENYDSDGVCGYERGGGNHSIHVDGMTYSTKTSRWLFDFENTWGPGWGSQGNGRSWLAEKHFTGVQQQDAWVHVDEMPDGTIPPQPDPVPPPPPGPGPGPSPTPLPDTFQEWIDNLFISLAAAYPLFSGVILYIKSEVDKFLFANQSLATKQVKGLSVSQLQALIDSVFAGVKLAMAGNPLLVMLIGIVQGLVDSWLQTHGM